MVWKCVWENMVKGHIWLHSLSKPAFIYIIVHISAIHSIAQEDNGFVHFLPCWWSALLVLPQRTHHTMFCFLESSAGEFKPSQMGPDVRRAETRAVNIAFSLRMDQDAGKNGT